MDGTVDAMAAAYDALMDAAAAALGETGRAAALEDLKRCLVAFYESCDRAEDLVQAAAGGLGSSPSAASGLDELLLTVHAVEKDLVQAAADDVDEREEKEVQDEKDLVQVAADDVDEREEKEVEEEKDLVQAAAEDVDEPEEKEVEEEKDSSPTPPVPVAAAEEDE